MRVLASQALQVAVFFALVLAWTPSALAQGITDPDSLSKYSFDWNQEERELGFLHYDRVFRGRDVPNGDYVYELPQGDPIAAFQEGGERAAELDDFLSEQKVAGFLILHDGKIRLERYALGLSESRRWTSQSVAKSVTSTLVGAAIKDGYINNVDDFLVDYIPDLKGSAYEKVTIHQLLTMTTGVRWTETYSDSSSDIVRFYVEPIDPGVDQTVSYMRQLPAVAEPGTRWHYSTGETHLLGVLVRLATGKTLSDYLSEKIWVPYGMEGKATWILGATDQELAGCCLQMKTRDFARYGQFVLDEGRIDGVSIVPDDWFETATRTHVQVWGSLGYGYQWWTYSDGTFEALGIYGQRIHIDPARGLVIVINSAWPESESTQRNTVVSHFVRSIGREIDKETTECP